MFQNLTVGKKIALGFGGAILLLVVVAGVAYYAINGATAGFASFREYGVDDDAATAVQNNLMTMRLLVLKIRVAGDLGLLPDFQLKLKGAQDGLQNAEKTITEPEQQVRRVAQAKADTQLYAQAFDKMTGYMAQDKKTYDEMGAKGAAIVGGLDELIATAQKNNQTDIVVKLQETNNNLLSARLAVNRFKATKDVKESESARKELADMKQTLAAVDAAGADAERHKALAAVEEARVQYDAGLEKLVPAVVNGDKEFDALLKIGPAIAKSLDDLKATTAESQDRVGAQVNTANARAITIIVASSTVALLFSVITAWVITRGIGRALRRIIDGLSSGAEQTASAATQVSSSSQSLAQGASEQAAAVEETSSSIEEMSSMTKQNSANASQAKQLAAQAKQGAEHGAEAMGRMSQAIDLIKKSSDQTAKIIKTIDEIAFQTNLLALNAAVEAARAGEAGKGFAVVAEEVRNLAQRSAEAAKNTANMIEESVKNSENGVQISKEVAQALTAIADGNRKVDDLVAEIASASQEQSQGIEQISTAIGQMDTVVQQTAANAEESASASEELSAQAEELNKMVADLQALVGGVQSHHNQVHGAAKSGSSASPSHQDHAAPAKSQPSKARKHRPEDKMPGGVASPRRQAAGHADAESVIPLENDSELSKF